MNKLSYVAVPGINGGFISRQSNSGDLYFCERVLLQTNLYVAECYSLPR